MWEHLFWADGKVLEAVTAGDAVPEAAIREYAHIIGAEEVWLARVELRPPLLEVWPTAAAPDLNGMVRRTHEGWATYLAGLGESGLKRSVSYVNSAGRRFENTVADILVHVAMHGQYHRGKVNQMLRQGGIKPAPVDFIAYVRGAPAATKAASRPDGA